MQKNDFFKEGVLQDNGWIFTLYLPFFSDVDIHVYTLFVLGNQVTQRSITWMIISIGLVLI